MTSNAHSSSILKYIIKRLLMAVLVLLFVSIIVFIAVRLCPGDPVMAKIGAHGDTSAENYNRVAKSLGLDKPYIVQYGIWLRDCLRGDFGKSLINGLDIREQILQKLPATIELLVVSMIFALVLAIIFGVASAIHSGSLFDQIIQVISTGFLAIPSFCLGLFFILLFSVTWNILPSNGYVPFSQDPLLNLRDLILPALTMGLMEQASLTRYIRSEMLEILNSNYVRTARAMGLPNRLIYYKHAFKNVMVTVITLIGMRIGQLIGGAVVIEQVFGWTGIGWLLFSSISQRDYPAVQAIVLLIACAMVLINMICDILYAVVDPRIKLE